MHVAKRTHAPGSLLVEGATYAVDPVPVFIPPTSNDLALHRDAVYRMRFEEFFDAACRGAIDRMFLSGGQIDGYGNTNVTAIGGLPHPKIKLGGGGGGCNISATIGTLTVWTTRHRSGRTLVPARRLPHRHRPPHPGGRPRRAGLPGPGAGVAGHRAGRLRLRRRARPAARAVPGRDRSPTSTRPPASSCASSWSTACSPRRPRPSWRRCARSTRSACAGASSDRTSCGAASREAARRAVRPAADRARRRQSDRTGTARRAAGAATSPTTRASWSRCGPGSPCATVPGPDRPGRGRGPGASAVPEVAADAAAAGVAAMVVLSGGFAETGPDGRGAAGWSCFARPAAVRCASSARTASGCRTATCR